MAQFGINFNGTIIPEGWRKRFSERKRIYVCPLCGHGKTLDKTAKHGGEDHEVCAVVPYRPKGETGMARLQGVATSDQDRDDMLVQANNGRRLVFAVRRSSAGGDAFGIYCY